MAKGLSDETDMSIVAHDGDSLFESTAVNERDVSSFKIDTVVSEYGHRQSFVIKTSR